MMVPRTFLVLLVVAMLPACSTWWGNKAPFGKAVDNMHRVQSVSPPVLTIPTEPPTTDGRKAAQALEAYRDEKQGGLSSGSGLGRGFSR